MHFTIKNSIEIIDFYENNGYAIIKNFFKKKKIVNLKNNLIKSIKKKKNNFFYYEEINKKKVLRRIERISDYSPSMHAFINSSKIINFINKLTKKKNVLFKDKLNFKYPNGAGYLPHLDGHFYWRDGNNKIQKGWKKYSNDFINLVIPLERADKKNGCLYISNKNEIKKIGNSWDVVTSKLIKNTPNIKKNDLKKIKFIPAILDIGDILLFDWRCPHYSLKNKSKKSRMIFYATYCKGRSLLIRKNYYYDKKNSKNDMKYKSLQFNRSVSN